MRKKAKKLSKGDLEWARSCASDALSTLMEAFTSLYDGSDLASVLETLDEADGMLLDARGTLRKGERVSGGLTRKTWKRARGTLRKGERV